MYKKFLQMSILQYSIFQILIVILPCKYFSMRAEKIFTELLIYY